MAGHSHWAGIKHKKGAVDAKRGKIFSKIARNIMSAARSGGDPDMNLGLKYAIEKARAVNMPRDNIARAIKKGTGELEGEQLEQLMYEGYGPGGVAVMLDILTDSRNRTAGEIRKLFELRGARLANPGAVAWIFEQKGLFTVPKERVDEDTLTEIAIEAGADNIESVGGYFEITCEVSAFENMQQALKKANVQPDVAEVSMIPKNTVDLDEETGRKVLAMMEAFEDHEDVQNVYSNFNLPKTLLLEQTG